jgi:hypothetical protein
LASPLMAASNRALLIKESLSEVVPHAGASLGWKT